MAKAWVFCLDAVLIACLCFLRHLHENLPDASWIVRLSRRSKTASTHSRQAALLCISHES